MLILIAAAIALVVLVQACRTGKRFEREHVSRRHYQRMLSERQKTNPMLCKRQRVYLIR